MSMNGEIFTLRWSRGIPYYSCRIFENVPRLRHGFSTRSAGAPEVIDNSFNLGYTTWDRTARVKENRRRFLEALELENLPLVTLHQIHSNRIHIIRDSHQRKQPEGDALATNVAGIPVAVQYADCLPILIADPVKKAVAAVHSGWRGTLSGVLIETIREMERVFGSDPKQLLAAIGPGIRVCCFEIGKDVGDLFQEYPECCSGADAAGKCRLDLGKVLEIQLRLAGVRPEHCFDSRICTRCNTLEFFSHRAEGVRAGRMMAVISL